MRARAASTALIAVCAIASGCASKTAMTATTTTATTTTAATTTTTTAVAPAATPDNSMTSLDWAGTYAGVVPCADCEGIETTITLKQDRTYIMKTRYLGKDSQVFERQGTFTWNEEGNKIQLSGLAAGPDRYLVGENALIQLDKSGNRITSDLAPKYVLGRSSGEAAPAAPAALFAPSWRLTEIMGQPVPPPAAGQQAPSLTFAEDGKIHGFAGCNNFTGTFAYQQGDRLSFAQVAATMKACPDMTVETEFLKVLGQVDNCYVDDQKLTLHKARMAPLARFEAVTE